MRQFAAAPIHGISYTWSSQEDLWLWKHPSDAGLPDLKCLKNVEQNYVIINEFISLVNLWMDFTLEQCYNVFFLLVFCCNSDICIQGYLHKTVTICLHTPSKLKV